MKAGLLFFLKCIGNRLIQSIPLHVNIQCRWILASYYTSTCYIVWGQLHVFNFRYHTVIYNVHVNRLWADIDGITESQDRLVLVQAVCTRIFLPLTPPLRVWVPGFIYVLVFVPSVLVFVSFVLVCLSLSLRLCFSFANYLLSSLCLHLFFFISLSPFLCVHVLYMSLSPSLWLCLSHLIYFTLTSLPISLF